jgi:hypothetical protein
VNHIDLGRFAEAARAFEELVPVQEVTRGRDHPSTIMSRWMLAAAYAAMGEHEKSASLDRETLDRARRQFGPLDVQTAGAMARLGLTLLALHRGVDSEPLLRECLTIRRNSQPEAWTTFNTCSLLGASLMDQGKYAEAEPLILSGHAGMVVRAATIPPGAKIRLTEAADRIVKLYDAWGKPEKAAAWRARLGLADLPENVFAMPEAGIANGRLPAKRPLP